MMNRSRFLRRLRGRRQSTRLIVPHSKAAGCLPRSQPYGSLRGVPTFRESIQVLTEEERSKWIGKVDLAERVWDVLDQDGRGSCAAESVTGAVMLLREVQGLAREKLNPWTMYQFTSGGRDRGSSIESNLRQAQSIGILPQRYWPRSKGLWTPLPAGWKSVARNYRAHEVFDVHEKAEFATALLYGFPVVYGRRGHAIVAVEWLEDDWVLYLNSWDESWNEGGFGMDSWRSIRSDISTYGAYAMRSVVDPTDEIDPKLKLAA